ncbi:hypothetical protein BGZ97_000490 [Linnemannia gamsii]|uniref:FAD-binding domain-containing protein n=1 Tax=Linnemannia gamsii TaxID=64522 RepID=A0A9P6RH77_9FUNG|nr:hypothetical protein BGZ97_000490 [Linnemannia gamsii]
MPFDDESSIRYPSQPPPISDGKNPHVMIVGAGLAGLLLGILLDKAGIPYQIYERAKEVKPLGAVMSLNAGILPALEQLGIYEDLLKLSLPVTGTFNIYNSDMTLTLAPKNITAQVIGYDHIVFPRPEFYDLLLSKVPREKIHFSKKVMSMEQNKEGVMIRCADGSTYHGDVLVGADGAYSGVRQALYRRMDKAKILPTSDSDQLNKGYICMVGTTKSLDPAKYPGLDSDAANINQVISKDSLYSWSAFSVPGNRICWNVKLQLATVEEATDHKFRNSEWGPETSEPMIQQVRDFRVPFGNNTLGDLIDATPRENISKVFLEDKLFDTWNHGRTVLIGDACHKLLPSAGLGAVTAMQDAVVLANCLYEMRGLSLDDIASALDDFKNERFAKSYFERFMRMIVFNCLPESVKMKGGYKGVEFRPQASFIPQIPVRGSGPVLPQKPSLRYQAEQARLKVGEPSPIVI